MSRFFFVLLSLSLVVVDVLTLFLFLRLVGNVPESETTVTEASPAPATAAAACPSPGPTERPGAEGATGESEPKAESSAAAAEEQEAEEDAQSNKSLDLDFASKLIDFKLGSPDPGAAPAEGRNSCGVCGKTFKYAATLARHRKAHACERRRDRDARRGPRPAAEQPGALRSRPAKSAGASRSDGPPPRREDDVEEAAGAGGGAPGARAPQPPTAAGQLELRKAPPSGSSKADKRKKICAVCSKRFWSLQDLTRHMRSHTG
ncbi:hypothetical protein chiPu_0027281, partial [Chiloscyllium punctatum]|nr:hypothetical protein [Chiloscyllium punctatum]